MNEKILEALEASLKRIQERMHTTTDRGAEATLFCKSEDLRLAIAAQKASMSEMGGK
jgi:hypothetical protein